MIDNNEINDILKAAGLRVTPQRIAVLEAVYALKNHPTTENIVSFIRKEYPNVAVGTVYNVIDMYVEKGIINRIKTEDGIMRYESDLDNHHHMFCAETKRIEDYRDKELDDLLTAYFNNKNIHGFSIKKIRLEITGNFKKGD